MILPEWTIQRKTEAPLLLGTAKRRKDLPAVQRFVTKTKVERAMPIVDAGLGDDVDESESRIMIFGRVRVQAKTNLADL